MKLKHLLMMDVHYLGNYDIETTYYLPIKCVNSLSKSPYEEFVEAYVVVGITSNYETDYYWVGKDKNNIGIENLTNIKDLNSKSIVKNIKNIDKSQLAKGTSKKLTLNYNDCNTFE